MLIYAITRNWFGLDNNIPMLPFIESFFLVEEKVSIAAGWAGALYRPDGGVGPALIIVDGKSKPEGRSTLH